MGTTANTFPDGIAAIDTMMGTTAGTTGKDRYKFLDRALKDAESANMNFPAQYMFKDVPFSDQARTADGELEEPPQGADLLLPFMDRAGVEIAMVGCKPEGDGYGNQCVQDHPDRFIAAYEADPNEGVDALRKIRRMHAEMGLKAITAFPSGRNPQVPIDAPLMYPIYALCVELDIPIFCCAGIPGPRVPADAQHVRRIDNVMYDFPELTFVTRHGCEPWEDLAVKLMLKWPGLHYSTSAFAPKHYPSAIIDYANTRGAEKVIYGGYFPMGLSLDKIFEQMRDVPFREHVWEPFLRTNAQRVLRLD
ncbi:MAG: amidohydrolase family protein [Acidimicrobiales bacterium]